MLSKIMKKGMYMIMCFIVLSSIFPNIVFASVSITNEAEEHILSQLRLANIPNSAVAVVRDGETSYILHDSHYDTLFQIGSVAKSFTGFGVLLLEYMGLLSVSDPVNKHLPWFEVYYNGVLVPHEDIVIANLLHHTSGITSDERRFPPMIGLTTDEFIEQLIGVELVFYPSTKFMYGNANYIILGFLIEAITGETYDEFMTQHVLYPLGLHNTFTSAERAYKTGRVIGGNRLGFFRTRSWNVPVTPLSIPTGFIYSNITDMARWAGIHLGIVDIPDKFARIVQQAHAYNYYHQNPFTDREFFYAAGWEVDLKTNNIAHGGMTQGYSSMVKILPQSDIAIVFLGNLKYSSMAQMGNVIWDSAVNGFFGNVGMDFFVVLDIVFTVLTVMGIVYTVLFVRLVIKLIKKFLSGERVKPNFTFKSIKWLLDPIISVMGLIAFYATPSLMLNTSRAFSAMFSPASADTAFIAVCIMVVYSLLNWWTKVFINPQT